MVELLKQKQFSPMPLSEQVISILAGSAGVLDDIEVSRVGHFLTELLQWLKIEAAEYLQAIDQTGDLDDALQAGLIEAMEAFKTIYKFSFGA